MGFSIDWWSRRGQGEWNCLHISFRERTGSVSTQIGNQNGCKLGKLGATYWTPAGYCKAVEVNKQAADIHTSHF